jgi:hypothetical protein
MLVDKCLRRGNVGVELGAVARAHLGSITRSVSEPESERAGKKVSPLTSVCAIIKMLIKVPRSAGDALDWSL